MYILGGDGDSPRKEMKSKEPRKTNKPKKGTKRKTFLCKFE